VDAQVKFYANTFGGTVFVTKEGEIVYALPMVAHASPLVHYDIDKNETGYTGLTGFPGKEGQCVVHRALCTMYAYCTWNFPVYYSETNSPLKRGTHPLIPSREGIGVCNTTPTTRRDTERRVPTTTVALKEQFVGAKVKTIQGEEKSVTKVNYFKGKDASKWKTDISTYDVINLGEVYDGIELKLKAYGSNVEKLFCVKPGANPEKIKISLSGIQPSGNPPPLSPSVRGTGGCPPLAGAGGGLGARGLWVNEHGELEVETKLGPVKFTKPIAYQEINGKRVDVCVEYRVESSEAENKSSKHKTCNSKLMSTNPKSNNSDSQNLKSEIYNPQLKYGFAVASYDKTKDLVIDPLLASTYLGGSSSDYGCSLALDTSGNVYVAGYTDSTNFPTTNDAYDILFNGSSDVFISKLDSNLSASPPTVLTGYATNVKINSATLDGSVNANGLSTTVWFEYDTTSGSYNNTSSTQSVSGTNTTIVSIDISGLSSETTYYYRIVAQSSSGTSYGNERSFETTLDTTKSPLVTTDSATNVTSNAATLNGTVNANGLETHAWFEYSTTSGTYSNVSSTQNVSGSSETTVSIDISGLYSATKYYYRITAQNHSGTSYGNEKSFTTSDASSPIGFLSINSGATYSRSEKVTLSLSATDNVGITAYYLSTNDSTPSASDTGWTSVTATNSYSSNVSYTLSSGDGSKTVYVWFKDSSGNISNSANDSITLDTAPPTITITSPTPSDAYTITSSVIAIGGSASDDTSGISAVAWSNDKGGSGTANGTTSWLTSSIGLLSGENVITVTATDGAGNTGTDTITVTYDIGNGFISGYVTDKKDNPIESAKISLKGTNSKILKRTISDEDGFFEFTDLGADTYIITAIKKGYNRIKQTVTLEAGEEKDIEIVMKKEKRR
jgi:hypothetical protein